MSLYSYSPEDVTILLLGFIPVEGYIDGTFISINKDIPPFTSGMTADGVQSRVHRISSSYTMRLVISNVSPTNDVLTKLWQIDEITKMGKFPILVKDQLGTSLFFSATSWIESPPSLYYSNRITEREWVIKCAEATINIGGNDDASGLINDLLNTVSSATPQIANNLF